MFKVTLKVINEVMDMKSKGYSVTKIADTLGCSPMLVRRIIVSREN